MHPTASSIIDDLESLPERIEHIIRAMVYESEMQRIREAMKAHSSRFAEVHFELTNTRLYRARYPPDSDGKYRRLALLNRRLQRQVYLARIWTFTE